jgi:hypothetical protein
MIKNRKVGNHRMAQQNESPDPSVIGNLPPYTWDSEESVAYEVALEAINEVRGVLTAKVAAERAKPSPDAGRIAEWRTARGKYAEVARRLDPTDHAEVARIRQEYPALARSLRES